MEANWSNIFYITVLVGLTGGAVTLFKKPLSRLAAKCMSHGIDLYYDMKYKYYLDLPDESEKRKRCNSVTHAPVIYVDHLDRYLIYKWVDDAHYATVSGTPPLIPDDIQHTDHDEDLKDVDDIECIITVGNNSRRATPRELNVMISLAGPGQDFTVSKLPTLSDLRNILEITDLSKVIFNNANYEEFLIH